MMMAEKRADASVKHSRVQERAHQSERRPSGKKNTKDCAPFAPSRATPKKRALTFSRYLSCWWVGLRAPLTGLKTYYYVALGVNTYT
jgi:hypothetical protein